MRTERCGAALDTILGQNAFDLQRVIELEPDFLDPEHDHEHDETVTSISLSADAPLDIERFQIWFGDLLREKGQDILRSKGILHLAGESERYVIQGVHMLMEGSFLGPWPEGDRPRSRLVFIGRGLEDMGLDHGFRECQAA